MVVVIHEAEFLRWHDGKAEAFLKGAGTELHRIAMHKASIQNEPEVRKFSAALKARRKGSKFLNKTQRTIYPNPSKPGESPRMRTGFGRKNIVGGFSRTTMTYRVGYTRAARYMAFHELGIRYKKKGRRVKRPTIVPALKDNRAHLVAVGMAAADRVQ
jgi:hypothetical protein